MKALVVTVSDRSSDGVRADESGPLAVEALRALDFDTAAELVPDERAAICASLQSAIDARIDVVITTGGTGLGPRDVTPEATADLVERPVPGLVELLRRSASVPTAALSRGIAGVADRTLIVNLAGSPNAVREGMTVLTPVLRHAVAQLQGADH